MPIMNLGIPSESHCVHKPQATQGIGGEHYFSVLVNGSTPGVQFHDFIARVATLQSRQRIFPSQQNFPPAPLRLITHGGPRVATDQHNVDTV